jgi:ATP-binding cassette, subfamily B, bacterial PglK
MQFFKEYFFLLGENKGRLPLIIILFLALSILELIGISLLVPFVSVIDNPDNLDNYELWRYFKDSLIFITETNEIYLFGLVLILVFILKNIFAFFIQKYVTNFSYSNEHRLRSKLLSRFLALDYLTLQKIQRSKLINVITRHITQYTNQVLISSFKLFSDFIIFLVIYGFLLFINFIPTLVISLVLIFAFTGYQIVFKERLILAGKNQAQSNEQIIKFVSELFSGLNEVRVLKKIENFQSTIKKYSEIHSSNYAIYTLIAASAKYFIEVIIMSSLILLCLLYVSDDSFNQNRLASLSIYGFAVVRLMPIFMTFISAKNNISAGKYLMHQLYDYSTSFKSSDDFKEEYIKREKIERFDRDLQDKFLELRNINFSYDNREKVLMDVNLKIQPGESIGIIGDSGSGKSTLLNIILGLIIPDSGKLLYKGKSIHSNLSEWWDNVVYIPQEKFLITGTVRENIALGIPSDDISDELLQSTISLCKLDELIKNLPQGIDTDIGEQGAFLSGGQKQRLCLARAIYFDKNILIMDEATSSLDNETESEITKEIDLMKGIKTTIIVAHRLTTLKNCDYVFKLRDGCLYNTNDKI